MKTEKSQLKADDVIASEETLRWISKKLSFMQKFNLKVETNILYIHFQIKQVFL